MAARKETKFGLNAKIFIITVIIVGAAIVLSEASQTGEITAAKPSAKSVSTSAFCSGPSPPACNNFGHDIYEQCTRHPGCHVESYTSWNFFNPYTIHICTGTALGCDSFTAQIDCNKYKALLGCVWNKVYPLAVNVSGKGNVKDSLGYINCLPTSTHSTCNGTFAGQVVLTAIADSGNQITGWSGACSGTSSTCTINMTSAKNAIANFKPIYTLTAAKSGTGTIKSSDGKINCGSDCGENYVEGTIVTLTATPSVGTFGSWSGCTSVSGATCTVKIDKTKSVTATFKAPLANGASCTSNSQCYSGNCASGKCAASGTTSCGTTTCTATQKCCESVMKCYAKTAACPVY